MILINQEQKLNVTNHYSMKFVIDSFFWEKLQDEELYKIISSTSTSINSDTILKGIKYNNYNNRKRLRYIIIKYYIICIYIIKHVNRLMLILCIFYRIYIFFINK